MSAHDHYLEDASGYRGHADRVIVPRDEEDVSLVLREANQLGVPVTVAGAGTGLTGGRVAHGGWVLSLEKFTHLDIRAGEATAGAGVLLRDLHAAAARSGQEYGPDPTETAASLGGCIATNASGSRSFHFGDTRRHVLRLRVALPDGTIADHRRGDKVAYCFPAPRVPATTKHTAGYHLRPGMDYIDLFIGSEGTLGVILEADVRLLPAPGELLSGVVFFPNDTAALDAVDRWRGIPTLRMLEYLDSASLDLLRARFPETPRGAALLIEDQPDLDAWESRLTDAGALIEASWFGTESADRERFRKFRHALPELVNDTVRRRGFLKMGSDYAVPLDRNREMLAYYHKRLTAELPGQSVIFGHIGDAHVHVNILPESEAAAARGRELMHEFARKAVELGGTVSAEHGLGKRKAHLLELQYTPAELDAMKAIKRRLDPNWILGRGTLWPV